MLNNSIYKGVTDAELANLKKSASQSLSSLQTTKIHKTLDGKKKFSRKP
jgi:hypothetical protein